MKKIISICLCITIIILPITRIFSEEEKVRKSIPNAEIEWIKRHKRTIDVSMGLGFIGIGCIPLSTTDQEKYISKGGDKWREFMGGICIVSGLYQMLKGPTVTTHINYYKTLKNNKIGLILTAGGILFLLGKNMNTFRIIESRKSIYDAGCGLMILGGTLAIVDGLIDPISRSELSKYDVIPILYPNYAGLSLSKRF